MKKYVTVINANGKEIDYDFAVEMMDDEIREELHIQLAPCTDQEFYTAYEQAHEIKYGAPFEI